jgi:hypothetical protein
MWRKRDANICRQFSEVGASSSSNGSGRVLEPRGIVHLRAWAVSGGLSLTFDIGSNFGFSEVVNKIHSYVRLKSLD